MIYEEYYNKYVKMVREKMKTDPDHALDMPEEVWITISYLIDQKIKPDQNDRVEEELHKLKDLGEDQMIETMGKAFKIMDELEIEEI
ncbi:MAG: hypothetical protein K6G62_05220 [Eubacterium sp.]|nr:hypothetical protein [Eubacterium sp.]